MWYENSDITSVLKATEIRFSVYSNYTVEKIEVYLALGYASIM